MGLSKYGYKYLNWPFEVTRSAVSLVVILVTLG